MSLNEFLDISSVSGDIWNGSSWMELMELSEKLNKLMFPEKPWVAKLSTVLLRNKKVVASTNTPARLIFVKELCSIITLSPASFIPLLGISCT